MAHHHRPPDPTPRQVPPHRLRVPRDRVRLRQRLSEPPPLARQGPPHPPPPPPPPPHRPPAPRPQPLDHPRPRRRAIPRPMDQHHRRTRRTTRLARHLRRHLVPPVPFRVFTIASLPSRHPEPPPRPH